MKEPRHLLLVLLARLALVAEGPEAVCEAWLVVLLERLLDVLEHGGNGVEVEWDRLPAFDLLDHFRGLSALAEVDDVGLYIILVPVLNKG